MKSCGMPVWSAKLDRIGLFFSNRLTRDFLGWGEGLDSCLRGSGSCVRWRFMAFVDFLGFGHPYSMEDWGLRVDNVRMLTELCAPSRTADNRPVYGDCGSAWVVRSAGFG